MASGTGLFAPSDANIQIALNDGSENAILVKCPTANIPSGVAGYAKGCILIDTTTGALYSNTGTASSCSFTGELFVDMTTIGNTVIGNATSDTLTVNAKLTGQLYCNDSAKTAQTLKIHNHLTTTTGIGCYEGKTETANTSGAFVGLWQDANINATGTASANAILGVATVASTFTVTGGTLIGTYGQVRADGTVAGSGFMAGLYGLVEEGGGAITASHVCSAWLDSHRNTAVTGSHQLLYMTNNGSATMDEAIYIYGGNKISKLMKLDTVSGMVADTAETGGTSKKIAIDIDGVTHYINAYTG